MSVMTTAVAPFISTMAPIASQFMTISGVQMRWDKWSFDIDDLIVFDAFAHHNVTDHFATVIG